MSQKSILSFFKQTDKSLQSPSSELTKKEESATNRDVTSPKKPSKESNVSKTDSSANEDLVTSKSSELQKENGNVENDSPIKKASKRKAKQMIDSDEESNEELNSPKVVPNSDKEKVEVDDSNAQSDKRKSKKSEKSKNGNTLNSSSKKRKKRETSNISSKSTKKVRLTKSETDSENETNENSKIEQKNASDKKISDADETIENSNIEQKNVREKNSFDADESIENSKVELKNAADKNFSDAGEKNSSDVGETSAVPDSSTVYPNSPSPIESDNFIYPKRKTARKSLPRNNLQPIDLNKLDKTKKKVEVGNKSPEKVNSNDSKLDENMKAEVCETETLSKNVKDKKEHKEKAIHPFFANKNRKKEEACYSSKRNDDEINAKIIKEETHSEENSKNQDKETNVDIQNKKKNINTSSTSSGVTYDPSKSKYHPINDACWKYKEKVPYLALAKTLELIENTSARLKIVEILSNYLRSVIVLTPEDLLQSVYLCLNRIAPEYEGIELGVGDMLLMKAVAQATGRTLDKIRAEVKEKGDLGDVAESSRGNQKVMFAPPKLTVASVFSKFKEIAQMSGNASMTKKTDKIQALFVACRDCEARYIIRSLSGKLRIGLAEQSVLAALSRAAVMTPPGQSYPPEIIDTSSEMSTEKFKKFLDEKTLILKTTYCECPNYDLVIPVLLKEGIDGLPKHCQLSPGCPLKPMLAHPTTGIEEVLKRFDNHKFTCEFKYDGERAQIHRKENGDVKIFSRNQEDNTSKYPDIIARIKKTLKESTKSFILDTEAVAWDQESKQILPFQILSTRKKKDAVESEIVVQVCVMAFDLLYLNGESLVKKPLIERRQLLHESFIEIENEFMFVTYKDGNSADTMQEFLDESIKGNCEGLMVKALEVDASYEIAKRSHNWLKLKKDYLDGVGDTLDLVVVGGYHGKGKRTGNYGGFLLACYDEDNEEFQSICKLGTGFKEDVLEAHTKFLKQNVIKEPKSYYRYDPSLEPDEWFEAVQVWEIKCADLSISPIHKAAAGIVDPEKGISLRFPRFLRIRDDKKPEEATNSSQIAELYQKQEQVQNTKSNAKVEEDYY